MYHTDVLNTTSQSQDYVIGPNSGSGESKQNPDSKDKGGGEELQIANSISWVNQKSHLLHDFLDIGTPIYVYTVTWILFCSKLCSLQNAYVETPTLI